MNRRIALKSIGASLLAPALAKANISTDSKPVMRIAHITDVHLKDKFGAPAKFTRCLHHLQNQSLKVDLILNGGDIVFDMNKEQQSTIDAQWKLYKNVIKNECSLPVKYCLGNHDIWWQEDKKDLAIYGKQSSMAQLQLTKPYYSFTQNGWKFILLDSVHLDIDGTWYIGKLGDEQFTWLKRELEQTDTKTPVLIMSHIPILTATNLIDDDVVNKWTMLGGDMHTDTSKIISLWMMKLINI